ncbi:MAG TPA: response regulator [Gammaproteobacteria bacterium]|nr:response regulator [Gammaproteobacteria bacterium]
MSKEKIFIVDDDRTTASVMQLYVKDYGYIHVGTARTGREAIEMARELEPDLVLMDINLGKGLDGIDAAEVITKHFEIPVVFVTSHADQATLERAKYIKPLGFINKPLRETDLKTTLQFAIAKIKPRVNTKPRNSMSIVDVLESLYNLTPAEARVVAKLVEYPDLKHASEQLNISTSTARTHLKRAFRKTNTNRQSALVHKIITGPAGLLINKD